MLMIGLSPSAAAGVRLWIVCEHAAPPEPVELIDAGDDGVVDVR
jgi:hypothetical protein